MCSKLHLGVIVLCVIQLTTGKSLGASQANKVENLFKSKESSAESSIEDRSFDICELFNVTEETERLRLRGHGVTVVMKLAS